MANAHFLNNGDLQDKLKARKDVKTKDHAKIHKRCFFRLYRRK